MTAQLATIGHNNPPKSDVDIVKDRLEERQQPIDQQIERIRANPPPTQITDDEHAGRNTASLKAIKDLGPLVTKAHKEIKAPYLECGNAIDAWKRGFETQISALFAAYEKPQKKWLDDKAAAERKRQAEEAEKARQEAEALAAEAAAHEAAGINDTAQDLIEAAVQAEQTAERIQTNAQNAQPYQLARSRSYTGATSSTSQKWVGEITNELAIDLNQLRAYFGTGDIQAAVNRFVAKGGRELAGVNIKPETKLNVR